MARPFGFYIECAGLGWAGLCGLVVWFGALGLGALGAGASVCFQGWVAGTFGFDSMWWAGLGWVVWFGCVVCYAGVGCLGGMGDLCVQFFF